MLVTRDVVEIHRLEHLFIDLVRRDKSMPQDYLTTLKLVERSVEVMIASILRDKGKIISKRTERLAAFFGYSL